jgi:type IVB pilus formation R64 PilN family outer membrane protein
MKITLLLFLALLSLTGCTNMASQKADQVISQRAESSQSVQVDQKARQIRATNLAYREYSGVYIDPNALLPLEAQKLPAAFSQRLVLNQEISIERFIQLISRTFGLKLMFTDDSLASLAESSFNTNPSVLATPSVPASMSPTTGMPALPSMNDGISSPTNLQNSTRASAAQPAQQSPSASKLVQQVKVKIRYRGSLKTLLDRITNLWGLSWRWHNNTIEIYRFETKNYEIAALISQTSGETAIGSSSSNSSDTGAQGGSQNTTKTTLDTIDIWKDVEGSLNQLIDGQGFFNTSRSFGLVTITTTPNRQEKIARYIDQVNKIVSRKIMVEVKVITVEGLDADKTGIDWEAVYTSAGRFGLNFTGGGLTSATTTTLIGTVTDAQSQFNNSKLLIQALSERNKVSVASEATTLTLNGRLVPIQVINRTNYLAKSSVTVSSQGFSSAELEPGSVDSGIFLNVLPRVINNDQVLLHYSLNMSSLTGLKEITSNDTRIQLPELSSKYTMQEAIVRSGETLVLTGFKSSESFLSYKGLDSKKQSSLGGVKEGRVDEKSLVIIITPLIVP